MQDVVGPLARHDHGLVVVCDSTLQPCLISFATALASSSCRSSGDFLATVTSAAVGLISNVLISKVLSFVRAITVIAIPGSVPFNRFAR